MPLKAARDSHRSYTPFPVGHTSMNSRAAFIPSQTSQLSNSSIQPQIPVSRKSKAQLEREELSGAIAIEVDNLIIKYNEKLPKCREIMEKYNEEIKEENENLLNSIKEELTLTQQYVQAQDNLLSVFDALKKLSNAIERYQDEGFERQKHTIIEYLEAIQEALDIATAVKEKVKDTAESEIYEEYVNTFITATEDQITSFELQCQDRKVMTTKSGKKDDINVRVARLLQAYKEGLTRLAEKERGPETAGSIRSTISESTQTLTQTQVQRPAQTQRVLALPQPAPNPPLIGPLKGRSTQPQQSRSSQQHHNQRTGQQAQPQMLATQPSPLRKY